MVACVLLAGCAHPGPAHGPSVQVVEDVKQAELAEAARKHDVARTQFQHAVADAHDPPSVAFARREFADTLISWGDYPEAIFQLEAALVAAPDDAGSWNDLGLLRHHQGDDPRAIKALTRARELAPANPRPRLALAGVYWKRGNYGAARREYTELLDLELPERIRTKVKWAIEQLAQPNGGRVEPPDPAPGTGSTAP